MKLKILYLIGISLLWNSCINNSIDKEPQADCSATTLDFTTTSSDASCGQSDGSITAIPTEGNPPYTYRIDNGVSQSTGFFENLMPGNYNITVTDEATCVITKEVLVVNFGGFQSTGSVTSAGCTTSNGTFTATPTGGVEPYSFRLDGGINQSTATYSNLAAGEHEVLISDADGCDFSVIKTILSGISYAASVKPIIANSCSTTGCHDGSTSQTNFTIFSNVQNSASGIRSRTQSGNMPKRGSLTQAEIDAIGCWVDDGALDN